MLSTRSKASPTGCPPDAPLAGTILISLDEAYVNHSNLGGFGPHYGGPQTIRLNNVGLANGRRIDMVISNLTTYETFGVHGNEHLYNGLRQSTDGTFGVVTLQAPPNGQPEDVSQVVLRFAFLDAGHGGRDAETAQPLVIQKTHFSFCKRAPPDASRAPWYPPRTSRAHVLCRGPSQMTST